MHKLLEGYGVRIQRSAFECYLDDNELSKLIEKVAKIINEKQDVLKIYRFSKNIFTKSFGVFDEPVDEQYSIV